MPVGGPVAAGVGQLLTPVADRQRVRGGRADPPDVYLAAVQSLGLPPERCVAVEDSTNGLLAAAAAELVVVALPRPEYRPSAEALGLALIVATHLDELTTSTIEGLDQ